MRTLTLSFVTLLAATPVAAATVDGDAFVAAARGAALAAFDQGDGLTLDALAKPAALEVVGEGWRLTADAPRVVAGGRVAVVVRAQGAAGEAGSRTVWFRAAHEREVAIATRSLAAHAVLRADDLRFERRAAALGEPAPVQRSTVLDGQRLRVAVRAGTPVRLEQVEAIPAVDAQQRVKVRAVSGQVAIEARGTARSSGAVGDKVEVMVDGAEAPVSGRVIAAAEVMVDD